MTAETPPEPYLDIDGSGLSDRGMYALPWHADLLVWMRDQGMNPTETRRIEVFNGDHPFARVTMYVRGHDGHRVIDETGEDLVTATETMPVSSLPPLPPTSA